MGGIYARVSARGKMCVCVRSLHRGPSPVGRGGTLVERRVQRQDGGQRQAEDAGPLQRRAAVAQIHVAARLGHLVGGGVGVAGEGHRRRLVALSDGQAALHLHVHETGCGGGTTHAHKHASTQLLANGRYFAF